MPRLMTTQALRYGTRNMLPGETFDARDQDAKILVAIGKATPVTDKPPAEPKTPRTRRPALPHEDPAQYARRDMRAAEPPHPVEPPAAVEPPWTVEPRLFDPAPKPVDDGKTE
jgi:hypothetical protein